MTQDLEIRPARAADIEALAALAERTFRDTFAADNAAADLDAYVRSAFSAGPLEDELSHSHSIFLLAFLGGAPDPIGYAKLRAGAPDPSVTGTNPIEIERLYVDQSVLGRRVGAALMRACLERAASGGHRTVWLGVWERNQRAIAFYERWGFVTVGSHVFRLGSEDQRDLILTRPVSSSAL